MHRLFEAIVALTWQAQGVTMDGFSEEVSLLMIGLASDFGRLPYPPPAAWSIEDLVERLVPAEPVPRALVAWPAAEPEPEQQALEEHGSFC